MRACNAAGPGSIPGQVFFGVFPRLKDKCREALGQQSPRISFGRHNQPLHLFIFAVLE